MPPEDSNLHSDHLHCQALRCHDSVYFIIMKLDSIYLFSTMASTQLHHFADILILQTLSLCNTDRTTYILTLVMNGDSYFLGRSAVQFGNCYQHLRTTYCPPLLCWILREQVHPKLRYLPTELHGVKFQKTVTIATAVRASNLIDIFLIYSAHDNCEFWILDKWAQTFLSSLQLLGSE